MPTSCQTAPSLLETLLDSAARNAERPALVQGSAVVSYADAFDAARSVAATISGRLPTNGSRFVGLVGARSVSTYQQLLGILLAGRGYLPLEPEQPAARLVALLDRAEVLCVLAESGSLALVAEICRLSTRPLTVVVTDLPTDSLTTVDRSGRHLLFGGELLSPPNDYVQPRVASSDPVYMLFTSGSTGVPKAVVINDGNVRALLAALSGVIRLGPEDVTAQLFKLSFDPSALNVLMSLSAGASLVVPSPELGVMDEARLIPRHGVTVWSAVPSRSTLMRRMRQLKPEAYPGLRYVIQGGEALTSDLAVAWSLAAPNARVLNQYGPTETTVCVVQYMWDPGASVEECDEGRVPIGHPLAGVVPAIVDDALNEVPTGAVGELLVSGPQVCDGYWQDRQRTDQAFVTVAGRSGTFYRTGDLVRQATQGGPLHFIGRADHQVKVLGRRIELGEVEAIARHALQIQEAAAVGWPETEGGYDGIELFVVAPAGRRAAGGREELSSLLPPEAVPRHVHYVDGLPLTANGKYDRKALRRMLDDSAG